MAPPLPTDGDAMDGTAIDDGAGEPGAFVLALLARLEAHEARERDPQRRDRLHEKALRLRKLAAKVRNSARASSLAAAVVPAERLRA